ncbi:hypothetical protein [[Eubacterium] hominis]|uniref:hypothetical protein n=1 Tax=[Eubacterium] hominis TaxID=2764325 RepID=UPI003A4D3B8F
MTKREENEFLKRIENAKSNNIFVQEEINLDSHIRGVYGFFAIKDNEQIPFYVGKSINIFSRMFTGHIYDYLRGVKNTDVQKRMEDFLTKGYIIEVRILKKVKYNGDSFIQDANRLALAELEEIVKQQENGYCITKDQLSEAVKREAEEKAWNDVFGKS